MLQLLNTSSRSASVQSNILAVYLHDSKEGFVICFFLRCGSW